MRKIAPIPTDVLFYKWCFILFSGISSSKNQGIPVQILRGSILGLLGVGWNTAMFLHQAGASECVGRNTWRGAEPWSNRLSYLPSPFLVRSEFAQLLIQTRHSFIDCILQFLNRVEEWFEVLVHSCTKNKYLTISLHNGI